MNTFSTLVFVGAFVQLLGIAFYVRSTLRGETKPNRVTWLMWALAPLIGFAAMVADGVTWAALPVFIAGFGPLLALVASFVSPKAYWKLERFDYLCGLFSLLALVLWGITGDPVIAIVFAIISDAFAAVPTLIKMWKHPETETIFPYFTSIFNQSTAFFAINTWAFSSTAFPIYLIALNAGFIFVFYRKKILIRFGVKLD